MAERIDAETSHLIDLHGRTSESLAALQTGSGRSSGECSVVAAAGYERKLTSFIVTLGGSASRTRTVSGSVSLLPIAERSIDRREDTHATLQVLIADVTKYLATEIRQGPFESTRQFGTFFG
jgi:hypothetical protein